MDYADIYYVDPRNATPVRDHRVQTAGTAVTRVPLHPATVISSPAAGMMPQYQYPAPYPQPYPPQYGMAPWMMPQSSLAGNLAAIVGGFGGLGSLADVVAQIFAAVLPLPNAPTPADAEDGGAAINSKNLITYQSALASYAKRDEQIRTIGALLKKLVG